VDSVTHYRVVDEDLIERHGDVDLDVWLSLNRSGRHNHTCDALWDGVPGR